MFLPILLGLYFITPQKFRNFILLIASLFFYAFGELQFLYLLLSVIIINYVFAILLHADPKSKKFTLILTLIINLGALFYFKYFAFLSNTYIAIRHLNAKPLDIVLPLGISFYIFQALSYIIDVYRNTTKPQKNIFKFALYICLFPQLVAGPIIKYHDIENQLDTNSRVIEFDNLTIGVKRFIIGLSKKVLIANNIGLVVDKIFQQSPECLTHYIVWLGAIAYTLQLFFDFSGYSDMAIGLGRIFGFKFMENFNYPFISKSITEFWHRWHISLSTWFKEYLYIPLGGNRCGLKRTVINLGIVFLLTGIWHGANWTFLIWGIWHGTFIIFEKIINLKSIETRLNNKYFKYLQHIYLILIVVCGFVIFRSDNLNYAFGYLGNMFYILQPDADKILYSIKYYIDSIDIIVLITAILISTPIFKNIIYLENKIGKTLVNAWLLVLFILSASSIAANSFNPFIYFRF